MNRRSFLKAASVAGLAATPTSAVLGYSPQHDVQKVAPWSKNQVDQQSPEHILLNDYRPKSIYKIPVTEIARATRPVRCRLKSSKSSPHPQRQKKLAGSTRIRAMPIVFEQCDV